MQIFYSGTTLMLIDKLEITIISFNKEDENSILFLIHFGLDNGEYYNQLIQNLKTQGLEEMI